jgi:putative flippase GtrA
VNTSISLIVFFLAHNYLFKNQPVHVGPLTISSYIAAYILGFCLSFPVGFYLSMFVVFEGSSLKRHHQLFRYFLVIIGCMILNYICLKAFVDLLGLYPTPSQMITTVIIILFNYFSQRYFSFKTRKPVAEPARVPTKVLD